MSAPSPSSKRIHILAISGSLRTASSNLSLLRATGAAMPPNVTFAIYDGLAGLPHFNPDLDSENVSAAVQEYRAQLKAADGLVISTPEYAHGVPGALKNALDWVVGSGEFMEKPVLLLNASLSANYAQASLLETLTVMMANVIGGGAVRIPLKSNKITTHDILAEPELKQQLQVAIAALLAAIQTRQRVSEE